ncbi:glycosyltransferase [Nocardioides zeae]|uniref:Glycosyltransferase n=1 Tax=Nocardioides imazamoxiresistens TaxID=3231893 RepID=A0ABU3PWD9_9ACTN|nr:glycosyltransferase [Nocardioides zeae]MDT9593560.1 glycosyltransferase [Nocardioides zeae]
MTKALYVASTGGHLAQLHRLEPSFGTSDDSLWVTFENEQSRSLLDGRRVHFVPYVGPRDVRGALRAARQVNRILSSEQFDLAVSTGAAPAATILPLAKRRGVRTVYIESVSRVQGPSLAGRIVAKMRSAETFTQHHSWAGDRWTYTPGVLGNYRRVPRPAATRPSLFVTLGTIEGFSFERLVRRIVEIGAADERTVWQLGHTRVDFKLPGTVYDHMSATQFAEVAQRSDVVVSHSGVGSLLGFLDSGIYPVLVTRRRSHREHVDDHQTQIAALAQTRKIAVGCEVDALSYETIRHASGFRIAPTAVEPAALV